MAHGEICIACIEAYKSQIFQQRDDALADEYWVDRQAGFTPQKQTDLVQFLLSIDDEPAVLPDSVSKPVAAVSK